MVPINLQLTLCYISLVRGFFCVQLQIVHALSYLGEKRVVLCNLAAKKILVETDDSVKFADFSQARVLDSEREEIRTGDLKLPVAWLAPETLNQGIVSLKTDVWALAVTLWEIFTFGESPVAKTKKEMEIWGKYLPKPQICSDYLYNVLTRCWIAEPENRISVKELSEIFEDYSVSS